MNLGGVGKMMFLDAYKSARMGLRETYHIIRWRWLYDE